jgi:hypothetical protein
MCEESSRRDRESGMPVQTMGARTLLFGLPPGPTAGDTVTLVCGDIQYPDELRKRRLVGQQAFASCCGVLRKTVDQSTEMVEPESGISLARIMTAIALTYFHSGLSSRRQYAQGKNLSYNCAQVEIDRHISGNAKEAPQKQAPQQRRLLFDEKYAPQFIYSNLDHLPI